MEFRRTVLATVLACFCITPLAHAKGKEKCLAAKTNGAGKEVEGGSFFGAINKYDKTLIKTAISAMSHSCAITQEAAAFAFDELTRRGWIFLNKNGKASERSAQGIIEAGPGRGYLAYHPKNNNLVIVFRGTGVKGAPMKLIHNAVLDAAAWRTGISWLPAKISKSWKGLTEKRLKAWKKTRVHKGFDVAYGKISKSVETRLAGFLANTKKTPNTYCIGFSLGAAMATHCAAHVQLRFGLNTRLVVGASPRVGDEAFRKAFDSTIDESLRIMLEKDPVAQIPGNIAKRQYEHVGKQLLPMYHDSKVGFRIPEASLVKLAHHWSNSRPLALFVKFGKYHHYLRYKEALRVQLDRCAKHCKKGKLVELVRAERKASSEGMTSKQRQAARKQKRNKRQSDRAEAKDERQENRANRKDNRKETRADRKEDRKDNRAERKGDRKENKADRKKDKKKNKADRKNSRDDRKSDRKENRADRKEDRQENRADRKKKGADRKENRQDRRDDRKENRADRKEDRKENRADRKDNRQDRRADRKDNRQDRRDDRKENRAERKDDRKDRKCEKQCRKKKSKKAEKKCIKACGK